MASDPSPSPPASLHEDSSNNALLDASPSTKKARRQTAFYPNVNSSNKPQKPFSRSAAKRESVMALGSIEHLQHYFTKTGIAAKKNPLKPNSGAAPAIGGPMHLHARATPSIESIEEFDLPPSPALPLIVRPPFPHVEKTYEIDAESLKPGVIQDLESVSKSWGFSAEADSPSYLGADLLGADKGKQKVTGDFDVLSTLKLTTRAIRSVRNYMMSLPDDSVTHRSEKQQFRALSYTPAVPKRLVSMPNSPSDPLTLIRRSALDVLTVLQALEESSRLPLSDEAYDAQSDHGSSLGTSSRSRGASPSNLEDDPDASFAFSVMSVPGRHGSVPVWLDEEQDVESDDEGREKREVWDQRLVLGSGWLYKQDIRLEDLSKEREAVGRYLDSADEVLFGGARGGRRGWERAAAERERDARVKGRRASSSDYGGRVSPGTQGVPRRIASAAMLDAMRDMVLSEEPDTILEEDYVDDDDLPDWAKRTTFANNALARTHALLTHLLPADLLPLLPSPSPDRLSFLEALSSGQLLCMAYNAGVRRSRKPWGYISKDAIHDIAALETQARSAAADKNEAADEKRMTGWTFRRTDNLRLWAAALKLRYLLPVTGPGTKGATPQNGTPATSPAPLSVKFPSTEPPLYFDARLVARKDEGWDAMLESAVLRWEMALVDEKRGER